MRALLNSTLAATLGIALVSPASASVIATFDYFGSATFGGAPQTPDLTQFPAGGASNVAGSLDIDVGFRGHSSRVGFGQVDPVISYGSGAIAAGDVTEVRSRTRMDLVITNDTGIQRDSDWQFLIFAGAAGLNTPDFSSQGCTTAALDQCDAWRNNLSSEDVGVGDSVLTTFSVELTDSGGTSTLFSGAIGVEGLGSGFVNLTESFTNVALDDFSRSGLNYSWSQTLVNYSLGLFDIGEEKTLTFITETVASSTGSCDDEGPSFGECNTAYGGFGDPPGSGGIVMYRSASSVTYPTVPATFPNAQVVFVDPAGNEDPVEQPPTGTNPPTGTLPEPSAALLFLIGFAPLLASRRTRRNKN